jgi:hypothetical protein
MWNWFNCYLSGRHEFGVWCEPGAIFLRCVHCGRRSPGWAVTEKSVKVTHPKATPRERGAMATSSSAPRVVPFNRSAAG